MDLLRKFINLILYGNFWIAACALAMVQSTELLLLGKIDWDPLDGLVFCGTWCLYAIHRAVGIDRLHQFLKEERYEVIYTYRKHIWVYAILGGIGSIYFFFQLQWETILYLILPSLLSLGYVVPFLGEGKRLRDINSIKIFLVAVVWAWITVLLPAVELDYPLGTFVGLIFLERMFFIFAITLPFDIRDLKVDQFSGVKTIPSQLGLTKSKLLGCLCTGVCVAIGGVTYTQYLYPMPMWFLLSIGYGLIAMTILLSKPGLHDYYYTGLMDGTMIIQFGIVYFAAMLG